VSDPAIVVPLDGPRSIRVNTVAQIADRLRSVAAVVADAGPANWTGKHYGGSPEVMAYLGLNVGMQKGAVVLFFVDDANNEIPLGPVEYNFKLR